MCQSMLKSIVGFDLDPADARRTDLHLSMVVLRKLPSAIYVQLDDNDKFYLPGIPCDHHALEL